MKETPLCKLAFKYGTDKCPELGHTYTPRYYELFKDIRTEARKVVEMGVGRYIGNNGRPIKEKTPRYEPGASLRMWRDFFPNAQVYGADILKEVLFEEDRIKTFYCNERKANQVKSMIEEIGSDIDIFVDDGLHGVQAQIHLAKTVMGLADPGIIYVAEDVRHTETFIAAMEDYDCEIPELDEPVVDWKVVRNCLVVVRHK